MNDEMITLPAADEMLTRLRSVIDEPHMAANLYPKITKYAGTRKTPEGIPPAVARGLMVALPRFVRVLCGTDDRALGDERS